MESFRTPDERFEDLPDWEHEPRYEEIDGLRLHYVSVGEGEPVVCFHGVPTWGYLYRKLIPPLAAAGHRVICPDYAGFGRSDKPLDMGFHSYVRHVELMTELLARLDVRGATVVVHDWGGPIGLRWVVENPDRTARLAILNTGLGTGRVSKGFLAWREFVERTPDLPIGTIVQAATATELPDAVVAAYDAPFPIPDSKGGPRALPLLVPLSEDDPVARSMREVQEQLAHWDRPCLLAFSDADPLFPFPRAGDRLIELVPSASEQVRVEGASHFLQEDAGERVAEVLVDFLAA